MGNNKKDQAKHIPTKEVNNVENKKQGANREEQQKTQGDKVVKWIFGALVLLAIIYMVWSMFIV